MARRRMFSLDVVDTDRFLDMPSSTQALYFHLGMRADDDGFVASHGFIIAENHLLTIPQCFQLFPMWHRIGWEAIMQRLRLII